MYRLSVIFSVALKLGLIAVMTPHAASQIDGTVVCQNIWTGREPVTLTFVLEKFDFTTRCPGNANRNLLFEHSAGGPSVNPYETNCTVSDITTSACDYKPGTIGCGCVKDNGSYVIEYNFVPETSFDGWWRATVPCFDTQGPSPLDIDRKSCDNLPTERKCPKLQGQSCSQEVGSVCELDCAFLDSATGTETIICEASGLWSGNLSACALDPVRLAVFIIGLSILLAVLIGVIFCCCCCCKRCRELVSSFCCCCRWCSEHCSHRICRYCRCLHDVNVLVDPKKIYRTNPTDLKKLAQPLLHNGNGGTSGDSLQRIKQEKLACSCCKVELEIVGDTSTLDDFGVSVSSSNLLNVTNAEDEVKREINKINHGAYDDV